MTPKKKMVAVALFMLFWSQTKSHYRKNTHRGIKMLIWYGSPVFRDLTCEARVDLKVLLSYHQPFLHGIVSGSELLVPFKIRWYWGSANIWQECRLPSCWMGTLTTSFSCSDKFLKRSPSSRELKLQWWDGMAAMKLFSRKWKGKVMRGITSRRIVLIWNLPNPLTSASTFSNFILKINPPKNEFKKERSNRDVNHLEKWKIDCAHSAI